MDAVGIAALCRLEEIVSPVNPDAANLPLADLDDLFYIVVVLLLPLLSWVGNLAKKHKQKREEEEAGTSPLTDEVYDVGPEVEQAAAEEPPSSPERPTWQAWREPQPSRELPPARPEHPARMAESARPAVVLGPFTGMPEPPVSPPRSVVRPPVARQVISEEAVPGVPPSRGFTSPVVERRSVGVERKSPTRVISAKPSSTKPPDLPGRGVGRSAVRNVRSGRPDSLRQAIVLAEILAPPIALRSDEASPGDLRTG